MARLRYDGLSAIDEAGKQQSNEAHLLAEVRQLLEEYAPVWYSADLRDRITGWVETARIEKRPVESADP